VGTAEVGTAEVGNQVTDAPSIPFGDSYFPALEQFERFIAIHGPTLADVGRILDPRGKRSRIPRMRLILDPHVRMPDHPAPLPGRMPREGRLPRFFVLACAHRQVSRPSR